MINDLKRLAREEETHLDVLIAPPWPRRFPPHPSAECFMRLFTRSFYLDLGHCCNQQCRFCFQDKTGARFFAPEVIEKQIVAAAQFGIPMVTLSGGEPLLYPDMETVLAWLRREGICEWGIMSNGLLLADAGRLDRLVEQGLGFCQLSFSSPYPAVQNHLSRNPHLFTSLMKALGNLGRHPDIPLLLKAVVVRPNVGHLVALVRKVAELSRNLGIRPLLTLTHAKPHAAMSPKLMVSAAEAAAAVAEAVQEGQRLGLPVFFLNLPFCLMDGLERSSVDWFARIRRMDLTGEVRELPERETRKNGRCLLCAHYETCPGFLISYAERFGDREFQPVERPRISSTELDTDDASHVRFPIGELRGGVPTYFSAQELRKGLPSGKAECRLVLCGPEPTLHPQLPDLVREYAVKGFKVWLETTGVTLAKPQRIRILKRQGLQGVLWLHPALSSPAWGSIRPQNLPQDFRRHILRSLSKVTIPIEHVYRNGGGSAGLLHEQDSKQAGDPGSLGEGLMISLLLGTRCNFRCEFCYHENHRFALPRAEALAAVDRVLDTGCRRFVLAGGEPTVFPHLMDVVERLAGADAEVILVTNGFRSADRAFCRRLKEAGIRRVILSLHSHKPEVVSRLVHVPDALPAVLDGFSNLIEQGMRICIHQVFNSDNYRDFEGFVRFYAERLRRPGQTELSVSNIIFLRPVPCIRSASVPRLSDIRPHLDAGIRLAREYGFEIGRSASEDAFPDCVYGIREKAPDRPPQERWIVDPAPGQMGLIIAGAREELPDVSAFGARNYYRRFEYTRACRGCRRKPFCIGVQSDYVALHGAGEIQAIL